MRRRARGEGSVYKRKDGSWVAQFNGTYRYAKTEQAARQKLYAMLAGAEESKPENITVAKHLDDYMRAAEANLKPRTVKRYREAIEAHLKPTIRRIGEGKRGSPYRYHKPMPEGEKDSSALKDGVPDERKGEPDATTTTSGGEEALILSSGTSIYIADERNKEPLNSVYVNEQGEAEF
jgi:hypothetical protein